MSQWLKVRITPDWNQWLQDLADHCRVSKATIVEQALYRYAEGVAFNHPPPRRTPTTFRRLPAFEAQIRAETAAFHDQHQADHQADLQEENPCP